jgi:hypothetical protein
VRTVEWVLCPRSLLILSLAARWVFGFSTPSLAVLDTLSAMGEYQR